MSINPLDHDNSVRSVAHKASQKSSESFDDLYQTGWIGLLKACKRFDSTKGRRFSTYAVPLIRGEILHYLRDLNGRSYPNLLTHSISLDAFEDTDYLDVLADWNGVTRSGNELDWEAMKTVWSQQWENEPLERTVLDLVVLQGMKRIEVGRVLGTNRCTVDRRFFSGIERLKRSYLEVSGAYTL